MIKSAACFAAVFIVLALTQMFSAPWLGRASVFTQYDNVSAEIVYDSLANNDMHGDAARGGFMLALQPSIHATLAQIIAGPDVVLRTPPHLSHFGGQYVLAKWLHPAPLAFLFLGLLCLFGMAIIVGGFCALAQKYYGRMAGLLMLACFAASPLFLQFMLNPYWLLPLFFLPILWALLAYQPLLARKQTAYFYAMLALLVMLKCLCGYEYLSNIGLGVWLALIWQQPHWQIRPIIRISMAAFCAVLIGFAAAAFLHIAKASLFFGNWAQGLQAFTLPLLYSTLDTSFSAGSHIRAAPAINFENLWHAFKVTYLYRNFMLCWLMWLILSLSLALLWFISGTWQACWRRMPQSLQRLLLLQPLAYLASIAWLFLAAQHSLLHSYLNWVTLYLFYLPLTALTIGGLWQQLNLPKFSKGSSPAAAATQ